MKAPAPLLVTAAIIERGDGKILIAQRKADSKLEGSKWEFPGGKVESFEDPESCLIREIREELDIEIRVRQIFRVQSHVYQIDSGPLQIILLCYLCDHVHGEIKMIDVQDAKWVSAEQMSDYTFAAADVPVVDELLKSRAVGRYKSKM